MLYYANQLHIQLGDSPAHVCRHGPNKHQGDLLTAAHTLVPLHSQRNRQLGRLLHLRDLFGFIEGWHAKVEQGEGWKFSWESFVVRGQDFASIPTWQLGSRLTPFAACILLPC